MLIEVPRLRKRGLTQFAPEGSVSSVHPDVVFHIELFVEAALAHLARVS